ncbi:MAG: gamma-glutamyltransferase [Draconibacterium sp.]
MFFIYRTRPDYRQNICYPKRSDCAAWEACTSQPLATQAALDYFRENSYTKIPASGPLPVSVPGCVDGWFELHNKFGKLSMKELLNPAISYAEKL